MLKEWRFRARKNRVKQVIRNKTLGITDQDDKINQSPPPKSFGFFKKEKPAHSQQSNLGFGSSTKFEAFSKKSKEDILKQAKEKLHLMAQTLEVVSPDEGVNEDIDMLLQLYEEQRSHTLSSNESEDEQMFSPMQKKLNSPEI